MTVDLAVSTSRRWENERDPTWTVEDLDGEEIARTVERAVDLGRLDDPGTRDPLALLHELGLTEQGVLLRAAVVLFGKKDRLVPQYMQCSVRAVRFLGMHVGDVLDNRQLHGNAFELLAAANRFFRENLRIASRFEPDNFLRIDEPAYPPLAVRQALANALCHRDYRSGSTAVQVAMYDDRLEVRWPGDWPTDVPTGASHISHLSQPSNPLLADVFFRRGVLDTRTRDSSKMVKLALDAGFSSPEVEGAHGSVATRFRPDRGVPRHVCVRLSRRHRHILALLTDKGPLPLREIVEEMPNGPVSPSWAKSRLKKDMQELRAFRLVQRSGVGHDARWERV